MSSAGIGALAEQRADEPAATLAAENGIDLPGHIARQFSRELGALNDLILTIEPGHRRKIISAAPVLSGKVMPFDHRQGGKGIADRCRNSRRFHEEVFAPSDTAGSAWAIRLAPSGRE